MKYRNAMKKYGRQIAAVGVITVVTTGQAMADAAAAAATITGAEGDVNTIGYASLGLLVCAALFKYMRRTV